MRTWLNALRLSAYKNGKASKAQVKTLVAHFAIPDETVLSVRWEITVPHGKATGAELQLRAIHMTPDMAESKAYFYTVLSTFLSC